MKKFAILLAFSVIASSAFAIVDDGTGSIGIYFDNTGDTNCSSPALFTPYNIYFIMANPEVPNMGAFELHWRYSPEPPTRPAILALTLPPQALNIGDQYNMIVGLGAGLITSEATVVASANLLATAAIPAGTFIQVGPTVPASHPGFISYVGFENPEIIHHMEIASGAVDSEGWSVPGVAKMGDCSGPIDPIATESETMSGIKALFQ